MARQKRFSELSPAGKVAVIVLSMVELALTAWAAADLKGRSAAEVRGPRWLWALVLTIQPVGPIAYLVLGRR